MQYQIRRLGVGGILDQGISLLRNHFGLLFSMVAMTIIPFNLIIGVVQVYAQKTMNLPLLLATSLLAMFVALFVIPLVNAAIIYAIASFYLSKQTSIGECFRHASQRFLPILGTWLLYLLGVTVGLMLCVAPGIIFAIRWMLVVNVATLEGIAGTAALSRSSNLMMKNQGTGIALGFIILVIQLGTGFGALLIPEEYLRLVVMTAETSIMTLFSSCAVVVFYFSCRCQLENFDLQVLADAVGAEHVFDATEALADEA